MKDNRVTKKKVFVRKRTGLSERPTIPYVRVHVPLKGKGVRNDRSEIKVRLRQEIFD